MSKSRLVSEFVNLESSLKSVSFYIFDNRNMMVDLFNKPKKFNLPKD